MSSATHWDLLYRGTQPDQVSWFRAHLDTSIELLLNAGLAAGSRVIDIGGGASTLVDDLVERGVRDVAVLDISAAALQVARDRLGARAGNVRWIVSDIAAVQLDPESIDIWHDRATLHFLTDPRDVHAYVRLASHAIAVGGSAVIGGFARIYRVARYRNTLASYTFEGGLQVLRVLGIIGMVIAVLYLIVRLGSGPWIRALSRSGEGSTSGIVSYVFGVYFALFQGLTTLGVVLFEFSRLLSFEKQTDSAVADS